jgi:hypothetical protein
LRFALVAALGIVLIGACAPAADVKPTFAAFVDHYLDGFAARHPSIAAGNGIHSHDDQLDDFSAAAIAREIDTLKAAQRELSAFDDASLTSDELVDKRILAGIIDGWLLEQETLANWKRNPMPYASALTDGVHNLMTMANQPAPVRMRRIISKLRGVPGLITAARTNLVNPPRIFAERGLLMFRSASAMLNKDLPLAFAAENGTPLMDSLTAAAAAAIREVDAYAQHRTDVSVAMMPCGPGTKLA